jgi:hypothetical protein
MRIIPKLITNAVLAVGLMLTGFTANATSIQMIPSQQFVGDGESFYVEIWAYDLPPGTVGGGFDVVWDPSDLTLDTVYIATDNPAENGGFPGNWETGIWSDPGIISPGHLTDLYVNNFSNINGLEGDQRIAVLNFTMVGIGVTDSMIDFLLGPEDDWATADISAYTVITDTITFTGAVVNPTTVIPVPAAVWLFGSGLLGLVGVARRRS